MDNITNLFPANDFTVVADNAAKEIVGGIIIGYDTEGQLAIFGGGLLDGRQPVSKDWLWLVEMFKYKLLKGDFQ